MSGSAHRGQDAEAVVIEIDSSGNSQVPVGLLQDVTVSVPPEYQTLTGAGTNKVVDVAQSLVEPEVSAEFGTFNESAFETLVDYDDTAGEIADTPEVNLFNIQITIPNAESGDDLTFAVTDCRPTTDISASPDDYATMSLEFTGQDIEDI